MKCVQSKRVVTFKKLAFLLESSFSVGDLTEVYLLVVFISNINKDYYKYTGLNHWVIFIRTHWSDFKSSLKPRRFTISALQRPRGRKDRYTRENQDSNRTIQSARCWQN